MHQGGMQDDVWSSYKPRIKSSSESLSFMNCVGLGRGGGLKTESEFTREPISTTASIDWTLEIEKGRWKSQANKKIYVHSCYFFMAG